jgi:hypothetical protein
MRLLRIAITLSALFWLIALVQQIVWLPHALEPRFTHDPQIGTFASRYALTSSVQLLVFVAAAGLLAFYVYRSRRVWAAVALCALFVLAFWQYFVAGLPIFFRPPLGDGSAYGAALGYVRFHSPGMWLHVTKLVLVLSCVVLWAIASYHISHASHQEV